MTPKPINRSSIGKGYTFILKRVNERYNSDRWLAVVNYTDLPFLVCLKDEIKNKSLEISWPIKGCYYDMKFHIVIA